MVMVASKEVHYSGKAARKVLRYQYISGRSTMGNKKLSCKKEFE
jgi:hypothetical protein